MAAKQIESKKLINDIRNLIAETRQAVAQTVNSGLVALYWNIGARIRVASYMIELPPRKLLQKKLQFQKMIK